MYHPEDYQVIDFREYDDGGMAFDVKIKGAEFTIYRTAIDSQPTSYFKFNKRIGYVIGPDNIVTDSVEIDWNTCLNGMIHLAEQMTEMSGIKFSLQPGFKGSHLTEFKEVLV